MFVSVRYATILRMLDVPTVHPTARHGRMMNGRRWSFRAGLDPELASRWGRVLSGAAHRRGVIHLAERYGLPPILCKLPLTFVTASHQPLANSAAQILGFSPPLTHSGLKRDRLARTHLHDANQFASTRTVGD